MSIIYPGNYVCQLNAYRGQGVEAIPGINYYSVLAVAMLEPTVSAAGAITGYTLGALEVLSPDLRQDDKPRLDKPAVVAAKTVPYYTAISAVNIKGTGTEAITVTGGVATSALTAVAGKFPAEGAVKGADLDLSALASGAGATLALTAAPTSLVPTDVSKQAYVIVEVASAGYSAAPTSDDVHVPFKVEAGQGT